MKKILLASTALAFASSAAMAAEAVTGKIGGYMFMGVGIADHTTDNNDELGILRDSEIHLGFSGSSDNGLTFDGRVELESFTTGDQIDENWGRVRGSFGEVLIGSNDTAGDRYGDVGIIYGPGARIAYYDGFRPGDMPGGGSDDGVDALGIHYATPNFSGFTASVSYHPNFKTDGDNDTGYGFSSRGIDGAPKDVISAAANYRGDFESFGFAVGGDYTVAEDDDDFELWSLGGEVSFSGFTVGVHYEKDEAETTGNGDEDWAIGLEYKTGPWTFGGGYSYTEDADCVTVKGGCDGQTDVDFLAGWVVYDISPGVRWTAGVEYGDEDDGDDRYDAKTFLDIRF